MRRPVRQLTIGAIAALALAGCGNDRQKRFQRDYTAAQRQLGAVSADVRGAVRSAARKTDLEVAAEFDDLAARTRQVVMTLDRTRPTDKAKGDLARLRRALLTTSAEMRGVARAARRHDAAAARAATLTLFRDARGVSTLGDAVARDAGLKVRVAAP